MTLGVDQFFAYISKVFQDCSDFAYRKLTIPQNRKIHLYYFQGLVNEELLQSDIIKPLSEIHENERVIDVSEHVYTALLKEAPLWKDVIFYLLNGGVICHCDGEKPINLFVTSQKQRSLADPTTEYQVYGPKFGFIENIEANISLIRRFIKDPRLKTKIYKIGSITHTKVSVMYLDGFAQKQDIEQIDAKLNSMNVEYLINLGQLNKKLSPNPLSIFPQIRQTERPDMAVMSLIEGKLIILVDNETFCSIAPIGLLDMYITSGDKSFSSIWNTTFVLILRYISMVLSTALPALYVALVAFHPELLTEMLALTIAEARSQIPLPASAEAFLMMFALDILVEASMRLPSFVGQTIGIVGALIIGTAAVEAGVVSTLMVIIISFTAISSFTSPSWELVSSLRVIRYGLLLVSSMFGLYGFSLAFCLIYTHLCSIENYSRPYLSPFSQMKKKEYKKKLKAIPWKLLFRKEG